MICPVTAEWYRPYADYAVTHGLFGGISANKTAGRLMIHQPAGSAIVSQVQNQYSILSPSGRINAPW